MITPKVKLYLTTAVIAMGVLPRIAYHSATGYIYAYERVSDSISASTSKALGFAGLQFTTSEKEIPAILSQAALKRNLNPKLLECLVYQESRGNPDAFSPKSAIGLTQIMPSNAKRCGLKSVSELWDTEKNINCGAQILGEELHTYKGNLRKALEAYNGGSRLVGKSSETAAYAQSIIEKFAQSLTSNQ